MTFQNEILVILSVFICFGSVALLFRLFGKTGIFAWLVLESVAANIEVLILVRAFGMEQTLGNVLFASTFLATDILDEFFGKKEANKAVWCGIASTLIFIALSLTWQLYIPSEGDQCSGYIRALFAVTPRVMCASLFAYFASEFFDVWLYNRIWKFTSEKCGDSKRFLWLRNNGSTLVSQMLNTVAFTLLAFAGMYDAATLASIMFSSYVIFVFTSLLDTPFIYLARRIHERDCGRKR